MKSPRTEHGQCLEMMKDLQWHTSVAFRLSNDGKQSLDLSSKMPNLHDESMANTRARIRDVMGRFC